MNTHCFINGKPCSTRQPGKGKPGCPCMACVAYGRDLVNKICASCLEPMPGWLSYCPECGCEEYFTLSDVLNKPAAEVRNEQ